VDEMMVGGKRIFSAMLVVAGLLLVTGCAPVDAPKLTGLVTVSGIVKLDGKPLPNATVTFVPITKGEGEMSAGGLCDSTGKYILRTGSEKNYGIKPGQYKVIISSFVMPDGTSKQITADVSPMQLKIEGAQQVVPQKYSDIVGSTLTSNVAPEGGNIDFDLTST
jgi:hypothetical protein